MELDSEHLKDQLPYYLTREQKDGLIKALSDFPEKMNYYTMLHKNDLLQGDGWSSLTIINFYNCEKKYVKGIIISNSCDISSENSRDIPPKVIFTPIIKLESYLQKLRASGVSADKIEGNQRAEDYINFLFTKTSNFR